MATEIPSGSPTAPVEPTLLADRYELRERIDAGGFGEVWLGHDRLLTRSVAIKLLDRRHAADRRLVDQFKREAQSAAVLNHPNIVAVYDWGAFEDTYFLVMEYVPGSNLKELIRRRGALPEATALRIVDQIAAALELAHQHGIVHCDVKPHNVLLDGHGRPKVTDFGIACSFDELLEGEVVGTAHYVSPERTRGGRVDHRSDLYSLGVVLYELLTGRVPFDGGSVAEIARGHREREAATPRALEAAVSPLTESVVSRLLTKEPRARFGSATELREAIAEAQLGLLASLDLTQAVPAIPAQPERPPAEKVAAAVRSRWSVWRARIGGAAERPYTWWLVPIGAAIVLALLASTLRGPSAQVAVAGAAASPSAAAKPTAATPSKSPPQAAARAPWSRTPTVPGFRRWRRRSMPCEGRPRPSSQP